MSCSLFPFSTWVSALLKIFLSNTSNLSPFLFMTHTWHSYSWLYCCWVNFVVLFLSWYFLFTSSIKDFVYLAVSSFVIFMHVICTYIYLNCWILSNAYSLLLFKTILASFCFCFLLYIIFLSSLSINPHTLTILPAINFLLTSITGNVVVSIC